MKIAIGNDHSIIYLKQQVIDYLLSQGHEVVDCGTNKKISTHYPIYGREVGQLVSNKKVDLGIVICATGIGITNAATKNENVRAILSSTPSIIKQAREEHDVNILGLGGRVSGIGLIINCIDTFIKTNPSKTKIKKSEIEIMNSAYNKGNIN